MEVTPSESEFDDGVGGMGCVPAGFEGGRDIRTCVSCVGDGSEVLDEFIEECGEDVVEETIAIWDKVSEKGDVVGREAGGDFGARVCGDGGVGIRQHWEWPFVVRILSRLGHRTH